MDSSIKHNQFKRSSPSEFLLCDDPIYNEFHEDRLFILHTYKPLLLAEVLHNIDQEIDGAFYRDEKCIFVVLFSEVENADVSHLLKRMSVWYYNYLEWLEKAKV